MSYVNENDSDLRRGVVSPAFTRFLTARFLTPLVLLLLVCFFSAPQVQAERATPGEMERVCQNWLSYMVTLKGAWAGETSPTISEVQDIVEGDTVLARCFSVSPSGYIVVPVLKELPPVKACSEECQLDVDKNHGFSQLLREVLLHHVRLYVKAYGSLDASEPPDGDVLFDRVNRQQWDHFLVNRDEFEANLNRGAFAPMDEVGPLLTTSWDQSAPYNNYCPMGDGGRCVVGCVATAAAQVMAYHQWPEAGYGSYTYWWNGDNSCGGSTPGAWLSADFSDSYDWANIPDNCHTGCSPEEQNALAELNYEVGVAFDMDYGHCGSGTWASMTAWETYFRYRDCMDMEYRSNHSADSWFNVIKDQINKEQPMEYYIYDHAIVCDGWREIGDPVVKQYHMNYGWDDGHNAWYTMDNLYCPWEGCDYMVESMVREIIPDRGIWLTADTTFGWVPFEVHFTGSSEYSVDSWIWDLGDGDSAFVESPVHTYEIPGVFDVTLAIDTGGDTLSLLRPDYIIALADSMIDRDAQGPENGTAEMIVYASNTLPAQYIVVPVEFFGTLNVLYDSFSTASCRTEDFEVQSYINYDPANDRYAIKLQSSTTELTPGNGEILKLYFSIPGSATSGQEDTVEVDGYASYLPLFSGSIAYYNPVPVAGTISLLTGCCIGMRGNVDGDPSDQVNIADLTYLVDYLFRGGQPPPCPEEGDVNGDGNTNVADLTYLVDYLFRGGPQPPPCP